MQMTGRGISGKNNTMTEIDCFKINFGENRKKKSIADIMTIFELREA